MNRNTSRAVMCTVAAIAAVTATTGAASTPPVAHSPSPVAVSVQALVTESADAAALTIPDDFGSVMGYRPRVQDDMVENPRGDCSSPIPLPSEFDSACKAHDLGYDLIRYAAATGTTVDPQWRRSIDAQLERRMHAACADRTDDGPRQVCDGAASVAATAVDVNSWRQSFGAPVAEPALPFASVGGGIALIALSMTATGRYVRRRAPSAEPVSRPIEPA
ncbi:MAG: hypothetical protein QME72_11025 [Rhodococcus sp. (in: high G+C Gram-positive bacteria)]|nr:hypothetical protein [Rhodococcus sp. (in: high G+C Gram-positive bacteria)]MDI6628239.1 hypothetical protein [Rhodococcus sp. (in: high G+C Gram-positive bacteria)]